MGLYISHLDTVTIKEERALYVYLLDYGWPDGQWEQLFKRHFMRMADRASETGAVVIGSMRGVHFGNEVLNWHRVGNLSGEDVLPALLITKTHPTYFRESFDDNAPAAPGLDKLLVVPLRPFCRDETDFLRAVEGVFCDLKSGLALQNFDIAKHDARMRQDTNFGQRVINAIEVKPGAFGVSVDLKALLMGGPK
ncbi:MAG: hypothetical protein K2P58_11385 [Hyphomonadaceae bacterium]|nr:hypothetical protein [Hyphomonadaceae bacterium]